MALTAYITSAGQAAIADASINGYKIDLVRFKLGNTLITEPDPAVIRNYTTLPGTIVYDSGNNPTDGTLMAQIADGQGVVVTIYLNTSIGDFTLGSAGLYLSDGTLFAVLKTEETYSKVKNSGSIVGNAISFPFVFAITIQEVLNLEILAETIASLPIVSDESELPSYALAPYSNYFIQEYSNTGRSAIACRYSDEWQFCLSSQVGLFEGWLQVDSASFDSGISEGDVVYYNINTSKWSLVDGLGDSKPSIGLRHGNGVRTNSFFYKENAYIAGTIYYVDSYPALGKLTTLGTNQIIGTAITSSILSINPQYITPAEAIIPSNGIESYQAVMNSSNVYVLSNQEEIYSDGYLQGQVIKFIVPQNSVRGQKLQIGTNPSVNINSGSVSSSGTPIKAGELVAGTLVILDYLGTDAGFRVRTPAIIATTSALGISYLPSPISITNNASDANNDIDFGQGNAQADDGSLVFKCFAMTKRLDANWVAGNNQGGLDTGTKTLSTQYYLYAIYNPFADIQDFLFSASPTSPTMPAGYTKKTFIASLCTDASANIRTGSYIMFNGGYIFSYNARVTNYSGGAILTNFAINVPAGSNKVMAQISGEMAGVGAWGTMRVKTPGTTNTINVCSHVDSDSASNATGNAQVLVNSSGQIAPEFINSGGSNTFVLYTNGWTQYY